MDQELTVSEARPLVSLGLLSADNAGALVSQASEVARKLKDVVVQGRLSKNISGRDYVQVEGWTTLGMLLGLVPREIETIEREDGIFVATVAFCRADGSIVTQASAECGSPDEVDRNGKPVWASRPRFARRSMAQTRATGKAARLAFSWIMSLAGYAPTPAEEMEGVVIEQEQSKQSDKPQTGDGDKPCTPKQAAFLRKMCQEKGLLEKDVFSRYGVDSIDKIPFSKVNDALAFIGSPH